MASWFEKLKKKITSKPVDKTAEFEEKDIADNKIFSLFSYLGILILIPVFATDKSRFARFHINQGLCLLITYIIITAALSIVFGICSGFFFLLGIIPNIGIIFRILGGLISGIGGLAGFAVYAAFIAGIIIGIINAVQGKAKTLPVVGNFSIVRYN